jgi:hypothetical protein
VGAADLAELDAFARWRHVRAAYLWWRRGDDVRRVNDEHRSVPALAAAIEWAGQPAPANETPPVAEFRAAVLAALETSHAADRDPAR